MSWNNCQYPECEAWAYRPDADYCESHRRSISKEAETSRKLKDKIAERIAKQVIKNQTPRPKPKKVSPKREGLNKEYKILADEFKKNNPKCAARINEHCTKQTDDVHHSRGRGIFLLDVSTFVPVCRSCHVYLTDHHDDALKRGLSFSRLSKHEPHKI